MSLRWDYRKCPERCLAGQKNRAAAIQAPARERARDDVIRPELTSRTPGRYTIREFIHPAPNGTRANTPADRTRGGAVTHSPALPPGPRTPAFWQLHGEPFTVRWAGYGTFVVLASPDVVRDVFRGDPHALHSGEGNEFLTATGRQSLGARAGRRAARPAAARPVPPAGGVARFGHLDRPKIG